MDVRAPDLLVASSARICSRRAFTLVELLVVIAILAIVAALLMPALVRARDRGRIAVCLNNKRQITLAWLMYAEDNAAKLALNSSGEFGVWLNEGPYSPNWGGGGMDWRVAGAPEDPTTNLARLTEESNSSLAKYLSHNASLYHCPADTFLSSAQLAAGWQQRARSVSMNFALGDGLTSQLILSGAPKHISLMSNLIYGGDYHPSHFFLRTTDLVRLSPSMAFVFIDEHPDSIWGCEFQTGYNPPAFNASTRWGNIPASYHAGGCTLSYADGHGKYKKWLLPQTRQPVRYTHFDYSSQPLVTDRRDILWLAMRMLEPEAL